MKEVFHHFLFCGGGQPTYDEECILDYYNRIVGGSLVDIAYDGRRR